MDEKKRAVFQLSTCEYGQNVFFWHGAGADLGFSRGGGADFPKNFRKF